MILDQKDSWLDLKINKSILEDSSTLYSSQVIKIITMYILWCCFAGNKVQTWQTNKTKEHWSITEQVYALWKYVHMSTCAPDFGIYMCTNCIIDAFLDLKSFSVSSTYIRVVCNNKLKNLEIYEAIHLRTHKEKKTKNYNICMCTRISYPHVHKNYISTCTQP